MRGQTYNPAAGRRFLGARRHAKMLTHQIEATADIDAVRTRIRSIVQELVAAYATLGDAEKELVEANIAASSAEYEAPGAPALEAVAS